MSTEGGGGKNLCWSKAASSPVRILKGTLTVSRPDRRSWPSNKVDAAISNADTDGDGNNGEHFGLLKDIVISNESPECEAEESDSELIQQLIPVGETGDHISISAAASLFLLTLTWHRTESLDIISGIFVQVKVVTGCTGFI